ncbi:MAG: hypothetical protein Q8P29_00615, partial [Candidatus Levybacteria bacterium]|nr:hypothetical protein [Candidatus Levybacteria bacterium]
SGTTSSVIMFSFQYYKNLIFPVNNIIALVILILSFGTLFINAKNILRKSFHDVGFLLLTLWISISLTGYFINKTFSEAYLPIFFPALIFLAAFSFDRIMRRKVFFIPMVLIIALITIANSYSVISSEYSVKEWGFSNRLAIVREIIKMADGRDYNIVGVGNGSQFESFTMNYEYLAWWLGNPPTKSPQKLKYIIQESKKGIFLIKNE